MGDEQYIEASRKAQFVLLAMLVLVALAVVSLEPAITQFASPSNDLRQNLSLLVVTSVIAFFVALFWVAYFARLGYRALKLHAFPPPGTIVVRRTMIRTGQQATFAGSLALAFAGLMGLFAILVAYGACLFAGAL